MNLRPAAVGDTSTAPGVGLSRGVLVAAGALMLPLAWLAAALGDLVSFALGKRLGRRFVLERGPRLGITAPRLERVRRPTR